MSVDYIQYNFGVNSYSLIDLFFNVSRAANYSSSLLCFSSNLLWMLNSDLTCISQTDQVVETLESVINEENCPTKANLELQEFENEVIYKIRGMDRLS